MHRPQFSKEILKAQFPILLFLYTRLLHFINSRRNTTKLQQSPLNFNNYPFTGTFTGSKSPAKWFVIALKRRG